jgi:hypothetical protein
MGKFKEFFNEQRQTSYKIIDASGSYTNRASQLLKNKVMLGAEGNDQFGYALTLTLPNQELKDYFETNTIILRRYDKFEETTEPNNNKQYHQQSLTDSTEVDSLVAEWVAFAKPDDKQRAIHIINRQPQLQEDNLEEHKEHYGNSEYVNIYRGGELNKETAEILSFTLDPDKTTIFGSNNKFTVKREDIFWTLFSIEDEVWVDVKFTK